MATKEINKSIILKVVNTFKGTEDVSFNELSNKMLSNSNDFETPKDIKEALLDMEVLTSDGARKTINAVIDDDLQDNEELENSEDYISNMQTKSDSIEDDKLYSNDDIIQYLDDSVDCLSYDELKSYIENK